MANTENVCDQYKFNEIFKKNSKSLYQYLFYKYGNEEFAKDAVQNSFLKLWENCKEVMPEKAGGFLYRVANNHLLNTLKKKKSFPLFEIKTTSKQHDHETPQFILEEKEYLEKLNIALSELSEDHRTTFLLCRVEGKKHQEIADLLGISKKAVEKRIYKTLKILREKLKEI